MSPHPAAYFQAAAMLFRAVRFPDMEALAADARTADARPPRDAGTDAATVPPKLDAKAWPGVLAVFKTLVGALPLEIA